MREDRRPHALTVTLRRRRALSPFFAFRYPPRVSAPRQRKEPPAKRAAGSDGGARLVLQNVRCFAHAEVPVAAPVTVIVGRNGSGKTTIAEAIASMVPGEDEGLDAFPLRREASDGAITLLGAAGEKLAGWAYGRKPEPGDRKVFVYGQYRALRPPRRRERKGAALVDPSWEKAAARPLPANLADAASRPLTRTLFDFDEYLFRDLAAYVALLADRGQHDPTARKVWERLRAWLQDPEGPGLEDVDLRELEGRPVAAFRRAGVPLPITDLSDGYRALLAVVIDLALRYLQLFAGLDDPLAGDALVVIDEVDLNLHPRWQRRVIEQLVRLFPGTRFVLTTHSPTIVQAAIDAKHVVVVLEEEGGSTVARALKKGELKRLDGAEVDSVLVAVFGLPSRYSPTYEEVEKRAAELRKKVEDGTATAGERKELLGALDELLRLLAGEEEREGTGPLMSEIARTQIAFLKSLEAAMPEKGGRRGPAAKKGR